MKKLLALLILLAPALAVAETVEYVPYNTAYVLSFELHDATNPASLIDNASCGAGDVKIRCVTSGGDGTEVNTTNCYADQGRTYSIDVTAAELQCQQAIITVEGAGFIDRAFKLVTTGNASAQLPDTDVTLADGSLTAAKFATDAITDVKIAASAANKIADHTLRRNTSNVENSSNGDTQNFKSLYGVAAQQTHRNAIGGGSWSVYESDDLTVLNTRDVTTNSSAAPITGVGAAP